MTSRARHLWRIPVICAVALSVTGCDATFASSQDGSNTVLSKSSTAVNAKGSVTVSGSSSTSQGSHTGSLTTFASASGLKNAKIQMFNSQRGYVWGYRNGLFQVLQTQDGGQTWKAIALPKLPQDPLSTDGPGGAQYVHASILDEGHMWLAYLQNHTAYVYTTTDNGLTWQTSTFSIPGDATHISSLSDANAKSGWVLLLGSGSTGASAKYLYSTADGGGTWKMINSSARDLPHNGADVEATLSKNGKNGLLATPDLLDKRIITETTTDGGAHFADQSLLLPANIQNPTAMSVFPVEINPHGDAKIAVQVDTNQGNNLVIYQESGGSWETATTQVTNVDAMTWNAGAQMYALIDQSNKVQIKESTDGGLSWYAVGTLQDTPLAPEQTVTSFNMTKDGLGYAMIQNANLSPLLYLSSDSGQHWTEK